MSKTFTDFQRYALNGPTMGTRWSALFFGPADLDTRRVNEAMQRAVSEVDSQMSTWKADSDLMRLNAAPCGDWVAVPERLLEVIAFGLEVGRASGGAFDIGLGDAVAAWGFQTREADPMRIRAALRLRRNPAHDVIELDLPGRRARKHAPLAIDLSGIAKGYGVDRLAQVARDAGINDALLSVDGELVALGSPPDGAGWTVAVERPDYDIRAPYSILELQDAAVATSGDYRHWIDLGGERLSHTIDPRKGGPLIRPPASVTVVAQNCMAADAWATALMVQGEQDGLALAQRIGLDALFLFREEAGFRTNAVGKAFASVGIQVSATQRPERAIPSPAMAPH